MPSWTESDAKGELLKYITSISIYELPSLKCLVAATLSLSHPRVSTTWTWRPSRGCEKRGGRVDVIGEATPDAEAITAATGGDVFSPESPGAPITVAVEYLSSALGWKSRTVLGKGRGHIVSTSSGGISLISYPQSASIDLFATDNRRDALTSEWEVAGWRVLTVSTPGEIQFLSNGGAIYITEITPTIQDSSLLGTKKPLVAGISVLIVSIAILFAGYRWYRSRTARTMVGHLNYGGQDISLIGKKSHVVNFNGYSAEFVAPCSPVTSCFLGPMSR